MKRSAENNFFMPSNINLPPEYPLWENTKIAGVYLVQIRIDDKILYGWASPHGDYFGSGKLELPIGLDDVRSSGQLMSERTLPDQGLLKIVRANHEAVGPFREANGAFQAIGLELGQQYGSYRTETSLPGVDGASSALIFTHQFEPGTLLRLPYEPQPVRDMALTLSTMTIVKEVQDSFREQGMQIYPVAPSFLAV